MFLYNKESNQLNEEKDYKQEKIFYAYISGKGYTFRLSK